MLNVYRLPAIATLITALYGCSGQLYTVVNPTLDGKDKTVEGVITYQPVNVIELYKTTLLVDDAGSIKGSSVNGECQEDKKMKFSIRADYNKPQLLRYVPGPIDKNSFTISLKDGLIASVNTESDPTGGLKDLASVLPFVKPPYAPLQAAAAMPPKGKALCNAGERFIGLYLAPEILPFNEMPK